MALDRQLLLNLLIRHEGLRLEVYLDSLGIPTIGIGHNLKANPLPFSVEHGITREQAEDICQDDITDTLAFLGGHCPWFMKLDDIRQLAIADMTFDLMSKILDFHGMIKALESQDWAEAANHILLSKFGSQTGRRAIELAAIIHTGTL